MPVFEKVNKAEKILDWTWAASKLLCSHPIDARTLTGVCQAASIFARVRNPKNLLLQIDPPTIVGCSLWYPIATSTMKP